MKQEKKTGKRRLKVNSKMFPRDYNRYVIFPEIRLSGKWLGELGFDCGEYVTIHHEENKIVITPIQELKSN